MTHAATVSPAAVACWRAFVSKGRHFYDSRLSRLRFSPNTSVRIPRYSARAQAVGLKSRTTPLRSIRGWRKRFITPYKE
jgi:hypothetical protein